MAELPSGTVTLLFTDIEGSTRLLQALGERYADTLATHQRLLRDAFAAQGGREVDTQGDAFFVAFPRALDAVRAAVAAQRALAAHPWPEGAVVRVRMGLHTGEPIATGGRYVGLAVHRAARVGAAGRGGQVLLSSTTHAVLRDERPAGIELRDLGEHRLKDFDAPEHLYQVVADGLLADFPPLPVAARAPRPPPPAPLAAEETPLVGRERELGLLRERLDTALGGRGGLVLLGGEAGIGKTALAETVAREAADRGALVLVGRCYDLTETPPYGPWREALAALPASPDAAPLPAALDPAGQGEVVAGQAALFARAHAFLAAAAAERPLLALLDDLHWADPASLDLLRFLARQVAGCPLLLLVTYRGDELTRRHPLYRLLPLLVREARAAPLDLRALPAGAVRDLLRGRYALPDADERRLADYLAERAEGHPLFVGELLRTLEAEGVLHSANGGWSLGDLGGVRVPRLLRQVIEGRLDRLDEEDQRLLTMAAVIGQEVPLDVWSAVSEAGEEALLDLAERAAGARLVEPTSEGARFAHALIREALYEGILPARRRGWHRRAAEALAASAGPDPDAVANHFRRAGDDRAAAWLVRAGERARDSYAWLTAAERFEAALALTAAGGTDADAARRAALLYRLARLRRYTSPRQGVAALEEVERLARAAGDDFLAACAAGDRGFLRLHAGEVSRGLAELAEAMAALDALPPGRRTGALALGGTAPGAAGACATLEQVRGEPSDPEHHLRGTLVRLLAHAGRYAEAEALAARLGDSPPSPARVRAGDALTDGAFGRAFLHAMLGRPGEARRWYAPLRGLYRALGHHLLVGHAALDELAHAALPYRPEHLAEREALAAEGEAAYRQVGGVLAGVPAGLARLPLLALAGRWGAARRVARAVPAALLAVAPLAQATLAELARERGDREEGWRPVRAALPAGPASAPGEVLHVAALRFQRAAARLSLDAGDLPTARAWLEAHDRWLAWSGAVLGQAEGQLGWAAYHRAAGDPAHAHERATTALARAGEPRQPLALLAAHRLLGELATEAGRHAGARDHLDHALALAAACAAPYERALTLLALAELRAATGQPDEARATLGEVRAICAPLGARPALARAEALATALAAS